MRTAANRDARWLFPGRRAGQPLTTRTIAPLIRDLGVPTVSGRLAALHQLVLQAPAPVVAQALGFQCTTTQRITRLPAEPGTAAPDQHGAG